MPVVHSSRINLDLLNTVGCDRSISNGEGMGWGRKIALIYQKVEVKISHTQLWPQEIILDSIILSIVSIFYI